MPAYPVRTLVVIFAAFASLRGAETTVPFRQGERDYSHVGAVIRADNTAQNSGVRDILLVGKTTGAMRSILSFNIAALPPGAVVTSVTLDLWTDSLSYMASGTVGALELHRLAGTPVEGTGTGSGGTGAGIGVTWASRDGQTGVGHAWTTAGGDFDAAVLASVPGYLTTDAHVQKNFASSASFVAAAQAAADSREPLNLIVLSPATEAGANNIYTRIASDDGAILGVRPRLTVTYQADGLLPPPVFSANAFAWSRVALYWIDPSDKETGFLIERRTGVAGVWIPVLTVGANVTQVVDSTADPSTSYTYRIKTLYADGESAYLEAVAVTTPTAVARASLVVMPLGDSITEGTINGGYRASLHSALVNAGYAPRFVGSQTNLSTAALIAAGNDHHEGHGGYTIGQIASNINGGSSNGGHWIDGIAGTREPLYPDVILLLIGANDIGPGAREAAPTLVDYDALLTKLAALRPAAHIICATLIPYTGGNATREPRQLAFNAGLPAIIAKHRAVGERVTLYDMRTKITVSHISTDFVHPTQAGYNAIGAAWFDALKKLPLLENWRLASFGSAAASVSSLPLADPDGDGASNLAEYAFGTNPLSAASNPAAPAPRVYVDTAGGRFLEFSFARRRDADARCQPQAASDLVAPTWASGLTQIGLPVAIDSDFETVTHRDVVPLSAESRRFLRLQVTLP